MENIVTTLSDWTTRKLPLFRLNLQPSCNLKKTDQHRYQSQLHEVM
jgi:hypothetical protein